MKRTVSVFLAGLLLITSCGKPRQRFKNEPVTPSTPTEEDPIDWSVVKTQLILFGAPPCSACKIQFPILRDQLETVSSDKRKQIAVKLYVETGAGWFDTPTVDIARKYRAAEGLRYPVFIDGFDKKGRPTYDYLITLTGDVLDEPGLPTAVILDKAGNFLDQNRKDADIFPPGATTFVPEKIVQRVLAHLGDQQ